VKARDPNPLSEAELQAADWFVRHDLGLVNVAEAARFRAWLSDTPNADAYAMFRDGWAELESLPAEMQHRVVRGLMHDGVCAGWAPERVARRKPGLLCRSAANTVALVGWMLRWQPAGRLPR
jgi:ferric-dicitrate binding protein FerR (iron transport regulator)